MTEDTIVSISKSLQSLCQEALGLPPVSLYHTSKSSLKDETRRTCEEIPYIPGRKHSAFTDINPCIAQSMDKSKLIKWINDHKKIKI